MDKVVGFMVVGAGEGARWLPQVLEQRKELVDDMVIAMNNVDENTRDVIKKSGFWAYDDDREWGVDQWRIKNTLLERVAKLKPSFILPSDADELYDDSMGRRGLQELMDTGAIGYYFAIINLWDDETHYRHDLSFWNVRFYRFRPDLGLQFEKKPLHCGLAPPVVYNHACHAPWMVRHYGIMKQEDRQRKVERYEKYDPNAKWKGRLYYDSLKNNKTVRPFDIERMRIRIREDVAKMDETKKKIYGS